MNEEKNTTHWKRNAGLYIAGQFLSMFGSMLVQHAITWHITLREQSGSVMAAFTCAALLPMVFISPFAGVWADRYNRKYLVNIADGAIALVTLAIAILYSFGIQNTWILLAVVVVRSIGQGVQMPASSALIPQIVPQEYLTRFNGLQSTAQSITMFAAPMAGGALLTFLPLGYIFLIDVITAAIGIAVVFFCVKVSAVSNEKGHKPGVKAYFHEMKEGIHFIGGATWLRTLLIAMALFGVLSSPAAMLTPLQVTRTFGADVWRLTAIEITFSLGMMAGGIAIATWGGFNNKVHTMIVSFILFGITTILFGLTSDFGIYLAVMILCGCTIPLFNTPAMTLMQTNIPPEMMGRVFSIIMVFNGLAMPLGMALFGPMGDVVKIERLLIVTGIMLTAGGLALYGQKELIRMGD